MKQTDRQGPGEYKRLHHVTAFPTLNNLGLSKRESACQGEMGEWGVPRPFFTERVEGVHA
jgi:hypothetical protein